MTCKNVFDGNGVHCEGVYSDGKESFINYSILMDIGHNFCNMNCKYCCCHPLPPSKELPKTFNLNSEKMIKLIKETDIKRGGNEKSKHSFEIWGGEPLFNLDSFKETVNALKKEWPDCLISTSSNGLVLSQDNVCDYLIKNKITLQLSHDGLGQFLRSKVDPLENEKIKSNFLALVDMGLLNSINCTLSEVNSSWLDNIKYWDNILGRRFIRIKLNHAYDSDYPFDFAFKNKDILRNYLSEFLSLYWTCKYNKDAYPKYREYILEQGSRYRECKPENNKSSCRSYQSFKYDIEGNYKEDWNFVIMTNGEYGECNLSAKVDNPGGKQPDYCKECEYKNQMECQHCGAMNYPKKCVYQKAWLDTLKTIWRLSNGNHNCKRTGH